MAFLGGIQDAHFSNTCNNAADCLIIGDKIAMKQLIFALTLILFFGCGGSDSPPDNEQELQLIDVLDFQLQPDSTVLTNVTNRLNGLSLDNFFEESYLIVQERYSQSTVSEGLANQLPVGTLNLNNISDEYSSQTTLIQSLILDTLLSYDRSALTTEQQLSYDIYQANLENQKQWDRFKNYSYPATYGFFGWPGVTEQFFTELVPINNRFDAETYLFLLNQIQRRFKQIEALLDTRQTAGIVEPVTTLEYSRNNVDTIGSTSATQTSYYLNFQTKINQLTNITTDEKEQLMALLLLTVEQRVLPAYRSLSSKMNTLLSSAPPNIGFGQFAGSDEFYQFSLNYFTSSEQTPDQIHQLGLTELARIHAEMTEIFAQLGYPQNETLAQLYARADIDGGTIQGSQAVAFYEDIVAEAYTQLPSVFSTIPQQQVVVIGGESGGYYIRGSDDGSRPGAFYASTVNDLAYTRMPTLAYHEAVPGHHLQIALAQELDLPEFRKRSSFTSFVEGWGLYAERLAKDLGWYEGDLYGDLGRLQFEAMRAARLVIDTGIHNRGWTYDQADQFHFDNVGFYGSIARYSVWPGQATAYMTGMLKFLELRTKAENELGENYDIKEFHSTVIGSGSMPTNLLEDLIDRYIAENLPANKFNSQKGK